METATRRRNTIAVVSVALVVALVVAGLIAVIALVAGSTSDDRTEALPTSGTTATSEAAGTSDGDPVDDTVARPTIPMGGSTVERAADTTVPATEPAPATVPPTAPPVTAPPATDAPADPAAPPTVPRFSVGQCLTSPPGPFDDPVVVDCGAPDAAVRVIAVADADSIDCPPGSGSGPVVSHSTTRSNQAGSVSFSWCTEPNA